MKIRRESKWLAGSFLLPLYLIVITETVLKRGGSTPWWRKFLSFEDTCAYGACFLLAGMAYLGAA